MRRTPGGLGSALDAVLLSGRAPRRWQEEVIQGIARLDDLQRAGSWIESWEAEASFQLRDGPFFGSALEELLGSSSRNDAGMAPPRSAGRVAGSGREFSPLSKPGMRPKIGLPLRTSPAAPPTGLGRREGQRLPHAIDGEPEADVPGWSERVRTRLHPRQKILSPAARAITTSQVSGSTPLPRTDPASGQIRALLQMERAAGRALLSRLAGDASPEELSPQQPPPWIREISRPQNRTPPGPARDADAHSVRLSRLVERALHSLRLHIDLPLDSGPASPAWSLPLDGPRASAQTLGALAGRSVEHQADLDRRRQIEPGRGKASPGPALDAISIEARDGAGASAGADPKNHHDPRVTREDENGSDHGAIFIPSQSPLSAQPGTGWRILQRGPWPSGHPTALERLMPPVLRLGANSLADIDPAPEASAGIAPPQAAGTLPPLLPAQAAGAASRAAAGVVEQGAKQEASGVEDDLGVLAEKIKRILDEEARRHGIDV